MGTRGILLLSQRKVMKTPFSLTTQRNDVTEATLEETRLFKASNNDSTRYRFFSFLFSLFFPPRRTVVKGFSMRPVKALKLDSLLSAGDVARKEVPRIVVFLTPSPQPLMALVIPICLLVEEKTGSSRLEGTHVKRSIVNIFQFSFSFISSKPTASIV